MTSKAENDIPEWSVYLIRCGDDSLYTGITTDAERRFEEHCSGAGKGAKYLRGRGPLELVLRQVLGSRGLALRVEARIKKLTRTEKEQLLAPKRGRSLLKKIVSSAREQV